MMDRSLEPVLSGLVPSLVGPLPLELVDLTASLVAQSRNRISSLKPAEEVARVYVCAHIACDRYIFILAKGSFKVSNSSR